MGYEQLPKLLGIGTKGLVVWDQIALVLVAYFLDRGIDHLVGVGGDANVLRSALQISTSLLFFSDGRDYKRSLRILFCSLGHRTKICASWVDSRIVEDELSGVVLPLVTPSFEKSSLMSPPLGDQTKGSLCRRVNRWKQAHNTMTGCIAMAKTILQ